MSLHFALDVPDAEVVRAVIEEAAIRDRDVELIEREVLELAELGRDLDRVAALALTLGRAGDPRSAAVLRRVGRSLADRGAASLEAVLDLAAELTRRRPAVERAELGYRFRLPRGEELFVEDPIAAYWHRRGRWGPPLRPDLDRAALVWGAGRSRAEVEGYLGEGGVVVVLFSPGRLAPAAPALRFARAGLARSPAMEPMCRWSEVSSIGRMGAGGALAYRAAGRGIEVLPEPRDVEPDALEAVLVSLLKLSRS